MEIKDFLLPRSSAPDIDDLLRSIKPRSRIADIGCFGWRLMTACKEAEHDYWGFDRQPPGEIPSGANFAIIGADGFIHYDSCAFDVVVLSHVIEHLNDPLFLLKEARRICKPGGLLWIEAPSEISAMKTGEDNLAEDKFVCFWDDPTHVRPYTPMAMYRIALSLHMIPESISRCVRDQIHCVRMCCIKLDDAEPRYVSLYNCKDKTFNGAWSHIWQESIDYNSFGYLP